MPKQIDIFNNEVEIKPKPTNKEKRNWENAFQRWCNRNGFRENIVEPYGVCGYGSMCDYCEDNTYGRPCVRALNDLLRAKGITLDYSKRNFIEIWCGIEV